LIHPPPPHHLLHSQIPHKAQSYRPRDPSGASILANMLACLALQGCSFPCQPQIPRSGLWELVGSGAFLVCSSRIFVL
jgi:hypothetical protein